LINPRIRQILKPAHKIFIRARNRLYGYDPVGHGDVPKSLQICTDPSCRVCREAHKSRPDLRIIYLLTSNNSPIGGNKVSYRGIDIIANEGVPCFAFHPAKPGFKFTWFANDVKSLKSGHFNPRTDFLVFPEMWAAIASKFCVPAGLRYAIFVQNGYLAHISAGFTQEVVEQAYRHADLVLSISEDTTEMISLVYPFVPREKIVRIIPSVPTIFSPGTKERLITYMPRKLRPHSERMAIYLQNVLPRDWRLQAIDQLDEGGVAALLGRSSVFLSFSEIEGYGLPPIEAAVAGNVVVGYTGQGAWEFFVRPAFREVPNGNFRYYMEQIRTAIEDVERGVAATGEFQAQIRQLAEVHSAANETAHLMNFAKRVRLVMSADRSVVATA
jgi:hypothetical protein